MTLDRIKLFAINGSAEQGRAIARQLGIDVSAHEEREFEDGEFKIRPLISVRGIHAYVIHSLYGDAAVSPSDKLWRLAVFIGALKDAGAVQITAVAPYLAFARKDRRTKVHDPITIRYVAAALEAVGCSRMVTLDVHNDAAFENAFRCGTDHLESTELFAEFLKQRFADAPIALVSPDVGGIKRVAKVEAALRAAGPQDVAVGFLQKHRSSGVVSGPSDVIGEISARTVVIVDDLIASGATIKRAVDACARAGAGKIVGLATHGLFTGDAFSNLADPRLEEIVISDTVPSFRIKQAELHDKLHVLAAAPVFAAAIRSWES